MSLEQPTVSVDRTVGHYWQSFDIDPGMVSDFYASLPHENKPPLSDCSVYFSALAFVDASSVAYGIRLDNPERSREIDRHAPPVNIMIFLGSFLLRGDETSLTPSEALAHELAHYAQNNEPELMSEEEIMLRTRIRLSQGWFKRLGFALSAASYSGAYVAISELTIGDTDLEIAGLYGLGAATLSRLISYRKRKKMLFELQKELHEIATAHESEVDAREHEEAHPGGLVVLGPEVVHSSKFPPLTVSLLRASIGNSAIHLAHRKLSLTSTRHR